MKYSLRLNQGQNDKLLSHLFPGDGLEAVALLICGRRNGKSRHVFTTNQVIPVPYDLCYRATDQIKWSTDILDPILREAYGKGLAIIKVHSHPTGYHAFSRTDQQSDLSLFASITSLLDDGLPHASV